jgi:Domain of unknown function (DUF4082)
MEDIQAVGPPVPIAAGTVYIAAYHTSSGYAATQNYFANALSNVPLAALSNSEQANGLYAYGTAGQFPGSSYLASNYWVFPVYCQVASCLQASSPGATATAQAQATQTAAAQAQATQTAQAQATGTAAAIGNAQATAIASNGLIYVFNANPVEFNPDITGNHPLAIVLPEPPNYQNIKPNLEDPNTFGSINYNTTIYGDCDANHKFACAQYAYLTFYSFFKDYVGTNPLTWDLLSSIYYGELGLWQQTPEAVQALTRNFFGPTNQGQAACKYPPNTPDAPPRLYTCTYDSIVDWLSQTYMIEQVATSTNITQVNLLDITIPDSNLIRRTENKGRGVNQEPEIFDQGMFAFDAWLVTNVTIANFTTWGTGQGPDVPSAWGNRPIIAGFANLYLPTSEQFSPIIVHQFNINGGIQATYGFGQNTQNLLNEVAPYCTYIALIITTEGRFDVQPCSNP